MRISPSSDGYERLHAARERVVKTYLHAASPVGNRLTPPSRAAFPRSRSRPSRACRARTDSSRRTRASISEMRSSRPLPSTRRPLALISTRATRASSGSAAPADESDPLHLGGEPADRWRADLLGGGEVTERLRSAHEHRERGELRRRRAGQRVPASRATKQMDRGGVQAVRQLALARAGARASCAPRHAVILVSKAK